MDRDLKFDVYVFLQRRKTGKNLSVHIRIIKFMTIAPRRNIMKVFIESQYGYYTLCLDVLRKIN